MGFDPQPQDSRVKHFTLTATEFHMLQICKMLFIPSSIITHSKHSLISNDLLLNLK